MHIGVLGINHKLADLSLRETLAKAFQGCYERISTLSGSFLLLSTCNREELYFSSTDPAETHVQILRILRTQVNTEFEQKLYGPGILVSIFVLKQRIE